MTPTELLKIATGLLLFGGLFGLVTIWLDQTDRFTQTMEMRYAYLYLLVGLFVTLIIIEIFTDDLAIYFATFVIMPYFGWFIVDYWHFSNQPDPELTQEVTAPPPAEPPPAPVTVPILPKALRLEHTLILGGTGSGKTQLLSQLISRDIFTPCSIVVFDSQGDLLHNILKVNFPRERVVYIDPTDVENPVALSFFDFNTSGETTYEREKNFNSVVELLLFVLNSLDSSVTSKQELCLRFLISFCLEIPGATIHTLRELLSESTYKQYTHHLPKLSETAQAFFAQDYLSRSFTETREQISRRVYTILQSPLERLFSSPKSRVNMREILDNGSIVLINTANSFLKAQGSSFLARFMTAMVFQAIQERNPQKDNLEVFMYIDEAAPVISDQITNILETARKYKLGLTLAFQSLSQVPTEYQQSIITNTSIKAVSGISAKDSRALSDDMGVKPEHLMATQKLTFFFYLKGVYLYPPYCPVEVGALGKLPQRTDLKQLIKENRAKYTQPRIMKQDATKPDAPDDDITGWKKS